MALVSVYGTLTDRERAASVLPAVEFRGAATLHGLRCVDGEYPTLAPGGETRGRLLETDHLAALDRYEDVQDGLYGRVTLPLADGVDTVETYVGDPDRLGVDVDWPGDPFPACVRECVRAADASVTREAPGAD